MKLHRSMKLYYAPGACSLAPHIVLRETGRRFDLEMVDLASHRTETGCDFMLVNPKGYVPALRLENGEILTEAVVIMQYLADLTPEKKLVPPHMTASRYRLDEMMHFIATEIHKQFGPLFKKQFGEKAQVAARAALGERFLYLQDLLKDQGYLMGAQFTIADAYLFVMLTWADKMDLDLRLWPVLEDYEQRIADRPSVQAALQTEGLTIRQRYRDAS